MLPTASSEQLCATYFTSIGTNCRYADIVTGTAVIGLNAYTCLKFTSVTVESTTSTWNGATNVLPTDANVTFTA